MTRVSFIIRSPPMLAHADSHEALLKKVRILAEKLHYDVDPQESYLEQRERCLALSWDVGLSREQVEDLQAMAAVFASAHVMTEEIDNKEGSDKDY